MLSKKLDEEFVMFMLEIEGRYKHMAKQDRIRIENWVRNYFLFNFNIVKNSLLSNLKPCLEKE